MRFLQKGSVKKTILVLSDIHLGAGVVFNGTRNPLEDFHYDKELVDLIQYYQKGDYAKQEVELIINGDLFDFLAVPYVKYFDDEYWSEEASLEKLKIMINAHREVVDALVEFSSMKKKKLVYIIGNHDGEMFLPKVRKYFSDLFLVEGKKNIKILVDKNEYIPIKGIVLMHGHEYERANRIDHDKCIQKRKGGKKYFIPPWGSLYVCRVINRFKKQRTYVNAVRPVKKFIINGLIYDTLFTIRFIFSSIVYFFLVRFVHLCEEKKKYGKILGSLGKEFKIFENHSRPIDDFFQKRPDIQGLIIGHTHKADFRHYPNGRFFINTGTWMKMFDLDFNHRWENHTLTYAQIDVRDKKKPYDISLNIWRGIRELPYYEF